MKNLEDVSLRIYKAVFGNRKSVTVDGKKHLIECTSQTRLRTVELGKYVFLEQNPEKDSVWGRKAREGRKILWVIEDGDYVANVIDGKFHDFEK